MSEPTPHRSRRSDRYRERYEPENEAVRETVPEPPADKADGQPVQAPVPYRRRRPVQEQSAGEVPVQPVQRQYAQWQQPTDNHVPRTPPALDRIWRENNLPPPGMDRPPSISQKEFGRRVQRRMPAWLITAVVLSLFAVAGLFTAKYMLKAYLVRCEDERQAAYQAVVDKHPVYFKDTIERYAEEANLHPAFVEAIILNESSYRTDAESDVGARGLMQLMPDTAEWIAGKLNISGYSFDRMYDAESNIRFGTWYLNYLSKMFRGDPILIACAYHAGQGTVTRWLSDPLMSSDGISIPMEKLPDGPTKTYAGRVTQDYAIYQTLYYPMDEEDSGSADGTVSGTV